ncbi:MAG TPA: hypothetical protein VHZ04_01940 [Candidatus Paceibacterota bacterium]|jgi:hypothetical protein|nr:hypothetical protein [Candidatus Paceibacterota bacterium]
MTAKMDNKVALSILAAIVLLAIIFLIYTFGGGHTPASSVAGQYVQPAPSYAPQGQLVTGFPQSLVLDKDPSFSQSYSVSYSASLDQYTAIWNSSSSPTTLFNAYKNYFTENGWTITNQQTSAAVEGLYANNGSAVANAVFAAEGGGSQVTIGYASEAGQ